MSTLEVDYNYVYGGEYDGEQTWPRAALLSLDKPDLIEVRTRMSHTFLFCGAGPWSSLVLG